jgi:hypothetical protein
VRQRAVSHRPEQEGQVVEDVHGQLRERLGQLALGVVPREVHAMEVHLVSGGLGHVQDQDALHIGISLQQWQQQPAEVSGRACHRDAQSPLARLCRFHTGVGVIAQIPHVVSRDASGFLANFASPAHDVTSHGTYRPAQ